MIRWPKDVTEGQRRRWRRDLCPGADKRPDGTCLGYSASDGDDEPCDVCKSCTRLGVEEGWRDAGD